MKLIPTCADQISSASNKFLEFIQSLCDLPHAVSVCYELIPQLHSDLHQLLPESCVQAVCVYLKSHVQYYVQYITYPDPYTLISWSQITKEFLDSQEFDRTFCDLWRAHVHLLMLHAQANWNRSWDQEQSCWFRHNDVCELLHSQFEIWLHQKSFDQYVSVN